MTKDCKDYLVYRTRTTAHAGGSDVVDHNIYICSGCGSTNSFHNANRTVQDVSEKHFKQIRDSFKK